MKISADRRSGIVTALLLAQGVLYYAVALRSEVIPTPGPLAAFPAVVGSWIMQKEWPLDKETADVLRADDTLNRLYAGPGGQAVTFFIAFFKTQRYGQAPHSPKNCLPGAGWEQLDTRSVTFSVPGRAEPVVSNQYVVQRGEQRSVVMYWYQSHDRIVASEYSAKFWLVADAIRYRRSDTAIVKVVVPVVGTDTDTARQSGIQFIQAAFPSLVAQLPK